MKQTRNDQNRDPQQQGETKSSRDQDQQGGPGRGQQGSSDSTRDQQQQGGPNAGQQGGGQKRPEPPAGKGEPGR